MFMYSVYEYNWNLKLCGFCGGRKPREAGENPQRKNENQIQTQSLNDAETHDSNPRQNDKK